MPKTIVLNKNKTQFFLSINKIKEHSFLMLGVYDENKVSHILCRVGKTFDLADIESQNRSNFITRLYNAVFFSSKAKIHDEGVSRKQKGAQSISYQAYDISFRQYLEFIQILEGLQTPKNQFKCYKPVEENATEISLELTRELLFTPRDNMEKLKAQTSEIRIGNTCRHTAIELIQEVQQTPISPLVSSNFFKDLPYKTQLDFGKPSSNFPFYILPVAPNAYFSLCEEKRKILTKLYLRMEHLLLLDIHTKETQDKFNNLKHLYTNIIGVQDELPINQLLQSIQIWKEENRANLNVLRVTYFWDSFFVRQSATMKLITEIETDLQYAVKASN